MIYFLGKNSKVFRKWYYRKTGRYYWNILLFIKDTSRESKSKILTTKIIDDFFKDFLIKKIK